MAVRAVCPHGRGRLGGGVRIMTCLFYAREAELAALRARIARLEGENAHLRQSGTAVREERDRLRSVLDSVPVGVLAVAPSGRLVFANAAVPRVFRRPVARTEGGTVHLDWNLRQADGRPVPFPDSCIFEVLRTGKPAQAEYLTIGSDGDTRWVGLDATPLREENGHVAAAVVLCTDVHGRREAATALAESEARLRLAQEAAGMGVFERDLRTGRAYWSPSMFRIWGLDPARDPEMTDADYISLLLPEDRAVHMARRDRMRTDATAQRYAYEMRIRRPDTGEVRWIASRGEFVRDAEGRAILVRGTNHDITLQREAEQRLAESEARFRQLMDTVPVGVWVTDAEGRCTMVNRHWCQLTGQSEAAALGHGWADALHPEDVAEARQVLQEAVGRRAGLRAEFRLRCADGRDRWMLNTGEPRFASDGAFAGHVGAVVDISERKETEERRALLAREVDHRAKNALAVVQSILRLTRVDDPSTFRAAVQGRIAALARAQTLLAREGWGGASLRNLVEEELAAYEPAPGAAARALLDGPAVMLAPGAAQPLAMALHELATNAAKYGALSTIGGSVTVTWRRDRDTDGLTLVWTERGGPRVAGPPRRRGFGTSVIAGTVERQLGGRATTEWQRDGLRCTIAVPSSQLRWPAEGAAEADAAPRA